MATPPRTPAPTPQHVLLPVKAVPGARRDEVVGWLGDRLKVRVAAPPEGGRANEAVCALVASALGVKASAVELMSGASNPEKTLRISGVTPALIERTWPKT